MVSLSTSLTTSSLQEIALLRAYISPDIANLGPRSSEHARFIAAIHSGFVKFNGDGIEAEIVPPGADWPITNSGTGHAHLDVRCRARTDAGDLYIQYSGLLAIDETTSKALSGASDAKSTQFGDTKWFIRLVMETSDPRLKWLETSLIVGQGRWNVDEKRIAAEYRLYTLAQA